MQCSYQRVGAQQPRRVGKTNSPPWAVYMSLLHPCSDNTAAVLEKLSDFDRLEYVVGLN
jgi:hypothetical protein